MIRIGTCLDAASGEARRGGQHRHDHAAAERYQPSGEHYVIPDSEPGLAGTYAFSHSYSAATGEPTGVEYPPGGNLTPEAVTTGYDAVSGLPTTLSTNLPNVGAYVAGQKHSAYGEPTVTTLKIAGGMYAEQAVSYENDTRRVHNVVVKPETSAGTVANRTFTYDPAGNVRSIADVPEVGQPDTQCFGYDPLSRLTSAWTPKTNMTPAPAHPTADACGIAPSIDGLGGPAPYWTEWTLDAIGNRTKEVSHAAAGDTVRTYTLPGSGAEAVRPHAVTAVTTTAPGQPSTTTPYGYDATGNITTREGTSANQSLHWDAEGKLTKVVEGTTSTTNLYDANGNRLIRRDATGTTLYLPGMEIRRQGSGTAATYTGTRYYSFAGTTIASRTPGTQALNWLFADHQGTQQITVNAYSQQAAIRRQMPYGGARGNQPSWPTAKGFVGGDIDPTGLIHIGAREYDAALGRFISVDPIMDLTDPQQFNPYAYSNNSPITRSDPTGLISDEVWEGRATQDELDAASGKSKKKKKSSTGSKAQPKGSATWEKGVATVVEGVEKKYGGPINDLPPTLREWAMQDIENIACKKYPSRCIDILQELGRSSVFVVDPRSISKDKWKSTADVADAMRSVMDVDPLRLIEQEMSPEERDAMGKAIDKGEYWKFRMWYGHAVHRGTATELRDRSPGRFIYRPSYGPDFYDTKYHAMVEITTIGEVPKHLARSAKNPDYARATYVTYGMSSAQYSSMLSTLASMPTKRRGARGMK